MLNCVRVMNRCDFGWSCIGGFGGEVGQVSLMGHNYTFKPVFKETIQARI